MKPVIYQVFPRLYTNVNNSCVPAGDLSVNGCGKFNHYTPELLKSIRDLGATHIWFTGVIEHASATDYRAFGIALDNPNVVKGKAGSPYAIRDYYDVDPDLAEDVPHRMKEFEALVKRVHKAGMKMIIDFVPNHVARQYHSDCAPDHVSDLGANDDKTKAFAPDNNFYYIPCQQFSPCIPQVAGAEPYIEFPARVSGNDCFTAFPGVNDWYETVKLNYGIDFGDGSRHFDPVPDTWYKMVNILLYWAGKGVDGFRCDMAHMVPVEFWAWAISIVREQFPKVIFIAEIYDTGLYYDYIHRAGFDYLYDKVNLYDTLRGIQTGNVSAAQLTNAWQRIDGLGPHMLNFLENHDEQRFGSPQYAGNPALVTPSLVVSTFFSTGPMMVYMAQELGEQALDAEGFSGKDGRTTIFDYWSMPTTRRWLATGAPDNEALTPDEQRLRKLYATVMNLANSEKAIAEGGFFDLMYVNYDNPSLNPHRHYTFLRHAGDDIILVAVNFDDSDAHLRINIPAHAFATMGVVQAEKPVAALDLLTSEKAPKNFRADMTFDTEVKAHGAVGWKIKNPAKSTKAKITKKASTSKKKS